MFFKNNALSNSDSVREVYTLIFSTFSNLLRLHFIQKKILPVFLQKFLDKFNVLVLSIVLVGKD